MISGPQPFASVSILRFVANGRDILWAVLLLALLCVAHGIYIVAKGRMGPRLRKSLPEKVLPYPQRLAVAALYLAVGIGLMFLVFTRGVI
jgi:hypothetical protein